MVRAFSLVGLLVVAVIALVWMVQAGKGVTSATESGVSSGSQRAYEEMKNDPDAPLDDPKAEMREALKGL